MANEKSSKSRVTGSLRHYWTTSAMNVFRWPLATITMIDDDRDYNFQPTGATVSRIGMCVIGCVGCSWFQPFVRCHDNVLLARSWN
jgi:hypothetical protein